MRSSGTSFLAQRIQAATLSDVAAAVDRVRNSLPVVTSEIGDTWIYGCASDPVKVVALPQRDPHA